MNVKSRAIMLQRGYKSSVDGFNVGCLLVGWDHRSVVYIALSNTCKVLHVCVRWSRKGGGEQEQEEQDQEEDKDDDEEEEEENSNNNNKVCKGI